MRYPTDAELRDAIERLPGGADQGLSHRAAEFLRFRTGLREEFGDLPRAIYGGIDRRYFEERLGQTGTNFYRISEGSLAPWWSARESGLDALDPELHAALVGAAVQRQTPTPITVRELTYRNPFAESLTAIGTGAEALGKVAGVIETTATLGSRRRISRTEATFAEQTLGPRVAMTQVDLELREEDLRRVRLDNAKLEQEIIALRIQNAAGILALSNGAKQQAVVDRLISSGQLDEADAVAALDTADGAALTEFAAHPPELERSHEPDPAETD